MKEFLKFTSQKINQIQMPSKGIKSTQRNN